MDVDKAENLIPESSEKSYFGVKYRIPQTRPERYLRFFRTTEGTEATQMCHMRV